MPPGDFLCAAPSSFLLLRFENGKVGSANGGRRRTWKEDNGSPLPLTNAAPKMREFERMKEGSSVETAPCGCRRHESTRNDRSPVRKILVRRHVLLQLDGVGVPSHCHFLNTWRPSLLFGSPEAARSSLSASRGVEFRARTIEWGTSVLNSRVRSNGTASRGPCGAC